MATRFYLGRAAARAVSVTADSGWEKATGHIVSRATTTKQTTTQAAVVVAAQGTSGNDTLLGQWVSAPLDSDQTISGNVKGQVRFNTASAATDVREQHVFRVVSGDGSTVRGTLLAMDTAALANEFVLTTNTNRKVPRGGSTAITSVNALAGDRIVLEIGARQHAAGTNNVTIVAGDDSATDLPEDETTTAANNDWIEFDQTITFATPAAVTMVQADVLYAPSDVKARVTTVQLDVLYSRTPLRTATDAPTTSDVVIADVSGTVTRTASDAPTTSDSATRQSSLSRTATDAPTTSDSASAGRLSATDAPTVSESVTRTGSFSRAVTEAPTVSDSAEAVVTGAGAVDRTTTESITASAAPTRAISASRTTTDAPTTSDSAVEVVAKLRTATDAPTLSESAVASRTFFRTVTDGSAQLCLDFTSGFPGDWTNSGFTVTGGEIVTGPGEFDFAQYTGTTPTSPTTITWEFRTPDPIDDDYWFAEVDAYGTYVFVDNFFDSTLGLIGLYIQGAEVEVFLTPDTWYSVKGYLDHSTGTVKAKLWLRGDPEPVGWMTEAVGGPFVSSWPWGFYYEIDGAGDGALDNICWTYGSAGVTDSIVRTLAATRTATDDEATDEWIVNSGTVDTPVYGQDPNGYQPELAAPIDDNDTTITVTQPLPPGTELPILVYINGEYVLVTAVSLDGLTWTVVRGANGSTVASHSTGSILPANTTVSVGGVQVGADVIFSRSRLSTYVNGQVGIGEIWIRDVERTRGFTTGAEVVVRHRNVRVWGGYIANIKRNYPFPSGTGEPDDEPRYLVLEVADYNILLHKRVYHDKDTPTHMKVKQWPNGTFDSVVIGHLLSHFLNIGGDGLSFDIHHVGTPGLHTDSCDPNYTDKFQVGWAGYMWNDVMRAIADETGAIYYIDPDKVFRYVDDSVKQSAFGFTGLSDDPGGTVSGYRDFELSYDGTKLVNEQFTWGVGQGATRPVLGHATAPGSILDHGLWQQAELRYDMYCQDTVDLRANTWLDGSPQNRRGHKDDHVAARATVFTPYFRAADVVTLESTTFDFSESMPIRGVEITFPTPWDIQCVLTITHEYDTPWEAYEFAFPDFGFDFHIPEIHWPPIGPFPQPCPCCPEECFSVDFADHSFYAGPGWGTPWTLTAGGGGTASKIVGGRAYVMDLSSGETASGAMTRSTSLDVGECFGGDSFNAVVEWMASGDFNTNVDPDSQTFGAGFYNGMTSTSITPGNTTERVQFLSFGSWSSGSFPPSVHISSDGAGTGYMYLQQHGTTQYYYAPFTFPWASDEHYKIRIFQNSSVVKVSLWNTNDPEPSTWQLEDATLGGNYDLTGHFAIGAGRFMDTGVHANGLTMSIGSVELSETGTGDCPEYTYIAGSLSANDHVMIADGETTGYLGDLAAWENSDPEHFTHGGHGDYTSIDLSNGCIVDAIDLVIDGGEDAIRPEPGDLNYAWHEVKINAKGPGGSLRGIVIWYRKSSFEWELWMPDPDTGYWAYHGIVEAGDIDATFLYDEMLGTVTISSSTTTLTYDESWFPEARIDKMEVVSWIRWWGESSHSPITVFGTLSVTGGGDPGPGPCADVLPEDLFGPPTDDPLYGQVPIGGIELDNGNFLYTFDWQFLPGSTEVWADGLRLRCPEDYDEHPENAAIEIHSDAQSGFTTFDPGMSIVANMVPFVDHDPPPEYVEP